jgi:hypothetical protein
VNSRQELSLAGGQSLLLCHRGHLELDLGDDKIALGAGDAALLAEPSGRALELHGNALVFVITIAAI